MKGYAVATTEVPPPIGRRMRAGWLLFGGFFTGVALMACMLGSWVVLGGERSVTTVTQQQSYQRAVTRIEVAIDNGDLSIATGGAGQVSIERRLRWSGTQPTVEESWQGDTLRISSPCDDTETVPAIGRECSTGLSLRVPADVTVEATVNRGTIRIRDVLGELRLATSQGDVQVTNGSNRLWIRSSSGEITATGLRCTHVDTKTASGSVSLEFAGSPELVKATAEWGDVDVAVPRPAAGAEGYQVRSEQEEGRSNIAVQQDPAARHLIFANTTRGNVYVRYTSA